MGTSQPTKGKRTLHCGTALSKYRAYLVTFAPRFLLNHAYITEFMFDQVVQEARDKLKGCKSPTTKYDKMIRLGEDDHPGEPIIKRGVVLGKRLLVDITDNELRWKILVDFWAEPNIVTQHRKY